jgi:Rad3-related DNA helicase
MSATILSHEGFALTLGLQHDKIVSVKEDSPFESKNKPIFYCPAGSMSYKNIEKTLPTTVKMINEIMKEHTDEKGIIHTHSIKIANFIKENLSSKHRSRILVAYGENRDKILNQHIKSKNKTVLLSPSMSEGVDLKGDLSKFQIICKVPFPYLGDKVIKKKMNKWNWWYDVQTVRTIVQSVGRSVRSENDTAVTYILDSDWSRVYVKNKKLFPESFIESYKD